MQPLLTVRFFATHNQREPVREWLKTMHAGDRKAIGADIKTVQYGWPLGMPLVRKMESGLWEVRANFSQGTARVLFTVIGTDMVLLHAFEKTSVKTPKVDIDIAMTRLKELHS